MRSRFFISLASLALALSMASCEKSIEYNSNSGTDGSRDSASQLLVNTSKVDDISAETGDNEDWYYFAAPEKGIVGVKAHIDNPKDVIAVIAIHDGFGRPLNTMNTNAEQNVYDFAPFEVGTDRYFISIKTNHGKSAYTIRADFEVPPPPVVVETKPDPKPVVVEKEERRHHSSCIPADRCKPGQRCCKPKNEEGIAEGEETVVGTVVLVTPQGDVCDIKISGIGSSKGVKKGAKAYLRGLKRKVDIYKCMTTSCQATIRATSEELAHYDKVDVVVD